MDARHLRAWPGAHVSSLSSEKNYIGTESYITRYYPVLHLPREHNYIHVINEKLFHVTDEKQSPTILHKIRVQSPLAQASNPSVWCDVKNLAPGEAPMWSFFFRVKGAHKLLKNDSVLPFSLGALVRGGCNLRRAP
jgi:hypothetical protein